MIRVISKCPSCGGRLHISALGCSGCGMELRNDFQLSPFDLLSTEQADFLLSFLKNRGNLRSVQCELGISYPTARRKLDDIRTALELTDKTLQFEEDEKINMSAWYVQKDSVKASDIIKRKLMESNGRVIVHTARGLPCEVRASSDGISFLCDKLPINAPYQYEVFNVIVDLLVSQGGRARKGNGRNHKLGEPECDETTVVGAIGYYKYGYDRTGKSVYDPVFALAAILEWAGIVRNERGELVLTADYQEACGMWREER